MKYYIYLISIVNYLGTNYIYIYIKLTYIYIYINQIGNIIRNYLTILIWLVSFLIILS
jgi:hypothetical protein